jgi:orotate phosphoribosyltransferase
MTTATLSQKNQLIVDLYRIGAIKFGQFTLKSGVTSLIYMDLRQIVSHPAVLRAVADMLWDLTQQSQFDILCGIPYTALPIATGMSLKNNIPMIMRRKEKKAYGTQQQIEGAFKPGQICLLIEDVITSGGSVLETAADLEANGLVIKDIAVLIDREQGGKQNLEAHHYHVHAALTLKEILNGLLAADIAPETERQLIRQLLSEQTS